MFERQDQQRGLARQGKRALEVSFIESPGGLCEECLGIVERFAIRAGEARLAEFGHSLLDVVLQSLDLAAQGSFLGRTLTRLQGGHRSWRGLGRFRCGFGGCGRRFRPQHMPVPS